MTKEPPKIGFEGDVKRLVEGKARQLKQFPKQKVHKHGDSFTTTRETTYRDRKIKIETTYKIIIDRTPVMAHIDVLNNGAVRCHALPNYSFRSALGVAKKLVDIDEKRGRKGRDYLENYGKAKPRRKKAARKGRKS